jgi:hypothetical protein
MGYSASAPGCTPGTSSRTSCCADADGAIGAIHGSANRRALEADADALDVFIAPLPLSKIPGTARSLSEEPEQQLQRRRRRRRIDRVLDRGVPSDVVGLRHHAQRRQCALARRVVALRILRDAGEASDRRRPEPASWWYERA